jgi:saccharopine dehydrogenase-like NADP-dependent oxidoreductase
MLSVRESKMHSKTPDILAYSTTKDGKDVIFRLGTLTCKGALPTGVAPAITAVWLAEGRVDPGVYAPEAALDPEPFFKELEQQEIFTKVSVSHMI